MVRYDIGNLRFTWGIIEDIIDHNERIKSFIIKIREPRDLKPGQFIMLWMPGLEEIPLSPSYYDGSSMRITVMRRGPTTSTIHNLQVGDRIFYRGPFGKGFNFPGRGKYLLVGGGYGASPVIYAAYKICEYNYEATYVEGVKTQTDALFINEAKSLGLNTILVTEDGSSGIRGLITDYIQEIISEYDYLIGCGPEGMLLELIKICSKHGVDCQLSFEAIIKCGIGLCGSCELYDTGLLVCRDGPVFTSRMLLKYLRGVLSGFED